MEDNIRYFVVPLPEMGMSPDTVDFEMPDNKAESITNFLLDREGRLVPRGPLEHRATGGGDPYYGSKGWVYDNKALVGTHDRASGAGAQYWAPDAFPLASGSHAVGDSTVLSLSGGTKGADLVKATGHFAPGLSGAHLGTAVFGPAYSDAGTISVAGGTISARKMLRWDGTTNAAGLTSLANTAAPQGVLYIINHYNRLWCLGGAPVSAPTQWSATRLWYSNINTPGGTPATSDWQTNGLDNFFHVGEDQFHDWGVGLAKVGGDLLILKRRSIWILRGNTSDTFSVKQITAQFGCVDPRSIVELDEAVYFMSDRGFMRFDGAQFQNVSDGINHSLLTDKVFVAVGDGFTTRGSYCASSLLPDAYIMVTVGSIPMTTDGTPTQTRKLMHDTKRGTWVHLATSYPTSAANSPWFTIPLKADDGRFRFFAFSGGVSGDAASIGDMRWITRPELVDEGISGLDTLFKEDPSTFEQPYYASFTSKWFALASPAFRAQLHRWALDYVWTQNSTNPANNVSWQVNVEHSPETGLPETVVSDNIGPVVTNALHRQSYHKERFDDVRDIRVRITSNPGASLVGGAAPKITRAEVRRFMIGWTETSRRF